MRKPHSNNTSQFKKQRLRVLRRDNYTCVYCGAPASQADHVIPKVEDSGPMMDSMENLVSACRPCNLAKGKKSQAVFLGQSSAPLVSPSVLSPVTISVPLSGPFQGQSEPLWA